MKKKTNNNNNNKKAKQNKKKQSEMIVAIEKCFKVALSTPFTLQTKWSCEKIGSPAANIDRPQWTKKKKTFPYVSI